MISQQMFCSEETFLTSISFEKKTQNVLNSKSFEKHLYYSGPPETFSVLENLQKYVQRN